MTEKKTYDFGEKKEENYKTKTGWEKLQVWQTPKYITSKNKAIDLIENGDYGLEEGDFWILKNKGGSKLCYTGLIISHNGCLKINDKQKDELKFKPSSVAFVKDEADRSKVMSYINENQGVYEFGEISPSNCKNDYPYAMVLKRLMDRVILKNSKVGFFGIYSEAESDDFKEKQSGEDLPESDNIKEKLAQSSNQDKRETHDVQNDKDFNLIKQSLEACGSLSELSAIWTSNAKTINALKKYDSIRYSLLVSCKDNMKIHLDPDSEENDINLNK